MARVYCDCYDTETGELLDADCRQNLKRVAHEFEQELGYQFLIGIEPETMWLKQPEDGERARGRDQALLLPHPPVRGAPSGAARRRRLGPAARPRHELRRPRGRARPARAELPLRPAGADRRQPHDLPPGVRRGGAQARRAADVDAQAVHRRVGQRPPPPLHARRRERRQRVPRSRGARAAVRDRAALPRRDARALRRADVRRQPDRQLVLPDVGHRLLGPDLQELGLAEPHHDRARRHRRAVRVPRRRLLVQPVPDDRRAAPGRPRRRAAQARSRARRSRATRTTCSSRASRSSACPRASAPRSMRWPPTR